MLTEKADPEKWNVKEVEPTIEKDPTKTSGLRNDVTRAMTKIMKDLGKQVKNLFGDISHLFTNKALVGGDQFELKLVELQTPQDSAMQKLDQLMLLSDNEFVKSQMGDFVNLARDRANKRAGQEMKAIKVPVPERDPYAITPKDTMIQETLTNVSTDLIVSLQQKYLGDVKRTIETGLVGGQSRKEVSEEITKLTGNLQWQAERIVRTEMIRAFNSSMRNRLESDGVQYWQWVASEERQQTGGTGKATRTCEVCWGLNGHVVKIGEPFMIHKGRLIRQPPDPHPNCRCTLRPATTKDFDEFHGFTERGDITQADVEELIRMLKSQQFEDFQKWARGKGYYITDKQALSIMLEEHPWVQKAKVVIAVCGEIGYRKLMSGCRKSGKRTIVKIANEMWSE